MTYSICLKILIVLGNHISRYCVQKVPCCSPEGIATEKAFPTFRTEAGLSRCSVGVKGVFPDHFPGDVFRDNMMGRVVLSRPFCLGKRRFNTRILIFENISCFLIQQ